MIFSVAIFLIFFSCSHFDVQNGKNLSIPEIITLGHKYTDWFYSDRLDSLINCMVDKEQGVQKTRYLRRMADTQFGRETEVVNERAGKSISNRYYYVRYSRFSKISQPVKIELFFDSNDNVFQFSVETLPREAQAKFLDYKTKTKLRLPFNGLWYVAAGGLNITTNHHAVSIDQRFAYDFLIKKDGFTFQNNGTRNDDYFCYQEEIVSPGAGRIVEVVNSIDENRPGEMSSGAGNYMIIDHGNNEFSILAHLKRGSIAVRTGEEVQVGQFVGLCGNSGHATMARLHYHLQNTPVIFRGEGLPIQFQSYVADGKEITLGEPLWNQYVMNKGR